MLQQHKLCDPIHGFIRFNDLEKQLIYSESFLRLQYIRQMGVCYLVYPGATHTRFEHSLGVMHLATKIYEALVPTLPEHDTAYYRQLIRLAALCHDLGHLPFSHTAEVEILGEKGHEVRGASCIRLLGRLFDTLSDTACEEVIAIALSGDHFLSQVITDDNFGADRIDYLIRDAAATGVGYGQLDEQQLIDSLQMTQEGIGVSIEGIQAVEALWIARYMMHVRVYHHPKARLFTHHMRRFMTMLYHQGELKPDDTDATVLAALQRYPDNLDAKILRQDIAPYKEVPGGESLLHHFSKELLDEIIVDRIKYRKGQRTFPVIMEDGKRVLSEHVSSLLRSIPHGGVSTRVYAPDGLYGEVERVLAESE